MTDFLQVMDDLLRVAKKGKKRGSPSRKKKDLHLKKKVKHTEFKKKFDKWQERSETAWKKKLEELRREEKIREAAETVGTLVGAGAGNFVQTAPYSNVADVAMHMEGVGETLDDMLDQRYRFMSEHLSEDEKRRAYAVEQGMRGSIPTGIELTGQLGAGIMALLSQADKPPYSREYVDAVKEDYYRRKNAIDEYVTDPVSELLGYNQQYSPERWDEIIFNLAGGSITPSSVAMKGGNVAKNVIEKMVK